MATKKTEVKDDVMPEEAAEVQEEKKPASAWDETIEMIVPRKPRGEDPQYYVCVNDRRYAIPATGKMEKLPKPIALILQDSLEAEAAADDYMDHMPNRSGEDAQQHAI